MITDAINLVGQPDFSHKILSLTFYVCTYAATVINEITTNKKTYIAVLCILLNVIHIRFIDFSPYSSFFLLVFILQSFIWPLARPATDEEPLIVELRTQTTKTLIRTSLSHASGGWMGGSPATGTITSSSKCVGQYLMLMQGK